MVNNLADVFGDNFIGDRECIFDDLYWRYNLSFVLKNNPFFDAFYVGIINND